MIAIIARGAVSGLGEQSAASGVGADGEVARVAITHDDELAAGGLTRPFASRADLSGDDDRTAEDRATRILKKTLSLFFSELDRAKPGWRNGRVGIALATSSGGMRSAEAYFKALSLHQTISKSLAERATYFAPMTDALADTGISFSPATLVLTACAASTIAIGIATRWLEAGDCDLVIAGGFDAVSVFVASGFEVLRATTSEIPPKPFGQGRDGMSLGEGAGLFALVNDAQKAHAYVAGFGASADAVHLTAPDRTGDGLARAAEAALANAEMIATDIDLVSAHATATPFNDAAEMKALARVLKNHQPTILPLKAQIGHTLGAAGVLETLACVDAIEKKVLPASASHTQIEPDFPAIMHARSQSSDVRAALKMSAAFGGANAALVITRDRKQKSERRRHEVFVSRAVLIDTDPDAKKISERTGVAIDKVLRGDGLCRYALAACAALEDAVGSLEGAGIVIGHSIATLETNYLYYTNYQTKGARFAEPRRFPYTTPNAVAGECGVAFGLTGPGLAVGSGFHGGAEALAIAAALVRAGDAEKMVVVAVDEIGDAARELVAASGHDPKMFRSGAVALLLSCTNLGFAKLDRCETTANSSNGSQVVSPGHRALISLCAAEIPGEIGSSSPHGSARIWFSSSAEN